MPSGTNFIPEKTEMPTLAERVWAIEGFARAAFMHLSPVEAAPLLTVSKTTFNDAIHSVYHSINWEQYLKVMNASESLARISKYTAAVAVLKRSQGNVPDTLLGILRTFPRLREIEAEQSLIQLPQTAGSEPIIHELFYLDAGLLNPDAPSVASLSGQAPSQWLANKEIFAFGAFSTTVLDECTSDTGKVDIRGLLAVAARSGGLNWKQISSELVGIDFQSTFRIDDWIAFFNDTDDLDESPGSYAPSPTLHPTFERLKMAHILLDKFNDGQINGLFQAALCQPLLRRISLQPLSLPGFDLQSLARLPDSMWNVWRHFDVIELAITVSWPVEDSYPSVSRGIIDFSDNSKLKIFAVRIDSILELPDCDLDVLPLRLGAVAQELVNCAGQQCSINVDITDRERTEREQSAAFEIQNTLLREIEIYRGELGGPVRWRRLEMHERVAV